MLFDAIVHAPTLRPGARLNIAQADQEVDEAPRRLGIGSRVRLRFGTCCPDKAQAVVIAYKAETDTVELAVGADVWALRRGVGGVRDRGLSSEEWYVAGEV